MNSISKKIWKAWYGIQGTWDYVEFRLAKLACRYLGHAKPTLKLHCEICSRCNVVLKQRNSQLRFYVVSPTIGKSPEKPNDKN